MAPRTYTIDAIPGDGIGHEVLSAAVECLDLVAELENFAIRWRDRDWGCDRYRRVGAMMPTDGIAQLADGDAIFLGAVGQPGVPDHVSLWGLLIPIRRSFLQAVNLRPIRVLPGVQPAMKQAASLDVVIVRENVEGEYSEVGGRAYTGTDDAMAFQQALFTRRGVQRVAEYAAGLAAQRSGTLVSATKSNGIIHTMTFWDEVVNETVARHPGVKVDSVLIDALAARAVLHPTSLDVIVASNLFGDILSDLLAGIAGSIGVAPSANLDITCTYPSMFEPVHGSAPDIAGRGIANPVGQIWTGAMMLEHLGEAGGARRLTEAFEKVMRAGTLTQDLGGAASTREFTDAVLDELRGS